MLLQQVNNFYINYVFNTFNKKALSQRGFTITYKTVYNLKLSLQVFFIFFYGFFQRSLHKSKNPTLFDFTDYILLTIPQQKPYTSLIRNVKLTMFIAMAIVPSSSQKHDNRRGLC